MGCLPCEKEVIDGGMARYAAQFLRDVASGAKQIVAAIDFYNNVLINITQPLAQRLVSGEIKISAEQHVAVMAQIDKQCYRADNLLAWGLVAEPNQNVIDRWVSQIFQWVKDDQTFYTALVAVLGDES